MSASPHIVLETAAFAVGGLLYWRSSNSAAPGKDAIARLGIVACAALGAALGSRLLYVAEYWTALADQSWQMWLGGKTLVGALLGGLIGVELAKIALGWRASTGNRFVLPLLLAVIIGRVGRQARLAELRREVRAPFATHEGVR